MSRARTRPRTILHMLIRTEASRQIREVRIDSGAMERNPEHWKAQRKIKGEGNV